MENNRRPLRLESLEFRNLMASVTTPGISLGSQNQLSAPVAITRADGMRAAEIRIQYDPVEVTTDSENIIAGSVWGDAAMVVANVNESAGTIVAFVFSAQPVEVTSGSLLDINFQSRRPTALHRSLAIDLQRVRLNEGQVPLSVDPVDGPDGTDSHTRHHAPPSAIAAKLNSEIDLGRDKLNAAADANADEINVDSSSLDARLPIENAQVTNTLVREIPRSRVSLRHQRLSSDGSSAPDLSPHRSAVDAVDAIDAVAASDWMPHPNSSAPNVASPGRLLSTTVDDFFERYTRDKSNHVFRRSR